MNFIKIQTLNVRKIIFWPWIKINIPIHRLQSKMIHYGNTIDYLSVNNFIFLLDYYYVPNIFIRHFITIYFSL